MHVETSAINDYGETVVANKLRDPISGDIVYRCQSKYWSADFAAWCRARRDGEDAPEPFSANHSIFVHPLEYGRVPLEETRESWVRRAIRRKIVANLHGWDREMRRSISGLRKLAALVRSCVDAQMNGNNLGAAPYLACLLAEV